MFKLVYISQVAWDITWHLCSHLVPIWLNFYWSAFITSAERTNLVPKFAFWYTPQSAECFHMTSLRPYWCPKTMKRRPCWCPKPVLWELNSFLMQTLSFVPINLYRCWPREWKHSVEKSRLYFFQNVLLQLYPQVALISSNYRPYLQSHVFQIRIRAICLACDTLLHVKVGYHLQLQKRRRYTMNHRGVNIYSTYITYIYKKRFLKVKQKKELMIYIFVT